jgi:DNA-binding SARP family transcriptional activator
LRAALGKQRGDPLAGLSGQWARQTREAWQREYLDAVCRWSEAELADGNYAPVIRRLSDLTVAFPFVEPLVAMLIRALSASGYSSHALYQYLEIRTRLGAELGIEPGEELQELHRALLGGTGPSRRSVQ